MPPPGVQLESASFVDVEAEARGLHPPHGVEPEPSPPPSRKGCR